MAAALTPASRAAGGLIVNTAGKGKCVFRAEAKASVPTGNVEQGARSVTGQSIALTTSSGTIA